MSRAKRCERRGKRMRVFIISDHEPTSAKVRQVLLREGLDCPAGHVVSLDLAAHHLAQHRPDLAVMVLPPDLEHALAVLGNLRLLTPVRCLVVGPASDSRLMLRALRGGASDFVDQAELEVEFKAALDRLRAELPAQAEPGRTIA